MSFRSQGASGSWLFLDSCRWCEGAHRQSRSQPEPACLFHRFLKPSPVLRKTGRILLVLHTCFPRMENLSSLILWQIHLFLQVQASSVVKTQTYINCNLFHNIGAFLFLIPCQRAPQCLCVHTFMYRWGWQQANARVSVWLCISLLVGTHSFPLPVPQMRELGSVLA